MSAYPREALVGAFVDVLKKFCKDVSDAYVGANAELASFRSSVVLFCNTCPDACARLFHDRVTLPHGDRIAARDESFFLTHDIAPDSAFDVDAIIDKIRAIWREMDPGDKASIWRYMDALMSLTRKIHASDP
jgi:hypothetical protein